METLAMHPWTRRNLLRLAVALPAGGLFPRFKAIAAPNLHRVKITNIRAAMAINNIAGNCLIRIDTDSGLIGYGEAGAAGPMARARIATVKIEGEGAIETFAWETRGGFAVHVLNYTNPAMYRMDSPLSDWTPVGKNATAFGTQSDPCRVTSGEEGHPLQVVGKSH
jgi:hypothetical protein